MTDEILERIEALLTKQNAILSGILFTLDQRKDSGAEQAKGMKTMVDNMIENMMRHPAFQTSKAKEMLKNIMPQFNGGPK